MKQSKTNFLKTLGGAALFTIVPNRVLDSKYVKKILKKKQATYIGLVTINGP